MKIYWESAALSFAVSALLCPVVIPVLKRLKFGQNVRDDGPARHLAKTGTPTMGGIIFLAGIAVAGAVFSCHRPEGLLVLIATLGYGLIGFLDDFIKIALKRPLGLRAREKLSGQILIGLLLAVLSVSTLGRGTDVVLPFSGLFTSGGVTLELGFWGFMFFAVLVMLSSANAVNLTDGLDGLASGVTVIVALAFLLIALITGQTGVAVLMAAVSGGCAGFLLYNHYPARVFMGDTGSLALGGALGAAAITTRSELFLLIIGGIYVAETLSVIIQVFSFQLFHRRVFRMAPLHHHFELGNWSENRIVLTFSALTMVFAVLGIAAMYRLG
ncbi:MAG: phospho-N-acetylmuramoyl-pentapeptide-transferase [Peptococcaceae bacterium BRH_c4b]|nr:MAG: phospho-N-acetylmuramoyl-pentapeptide-transferase [Peptococcaceae bacterium BRH_c4b]